MAGALGGESPRRHPPARRRFMHSLASQIGHGASCQRRWLLRK